MLQNSQFFVDWPRLVPVHGYTDSIAMESPQPIETAVYLPRKFGNQVQRRGSKELSQLEKGDQIPLKKIS